MSLANGTVHTNGHAAPPAAPASANPLTVFRIVYGQMFHMRTISPHYGGCWTHWVGNRSRYCQHPDCPPNYHRHERTWKGYAAVEIYAAERRRWVPFVLEITEHLELDFRDVWERGQVWELWREEKIGKKQAPVQGKLHERRDPATFPPVWDVRPCLLHLFHLQKIDLSVPNPLPPRMFMAESEGEAPQALNRRGSEGQTLTPEQYAELRRKYDENRKSPTERRQQRG